MADNSVLAFSLNEYLSKYNREMIPDFFGFGTDFIFLDFLSFRTYECLNPNSNGLFRGHFRQTMTEMFNDQTN